MLKKYLEHMQSKEPHERRRHALAAAGVLTGVFFVAWLVTLPLRLAPSAAPSTATTDNSLAAAAAEAQASDQPGVEVSSTSVYSLPDESQ